MNNGATNVNVHVGRLVLDSISVPRHQQPLLQAAFEAELTHLLTANGLALGWQAGRAVRDLSAGEIQLAGGGNVVHMGEQIARAVYESLG